LWPKEGADVVEDEIVEGIEFAEILVENEPHRVDAGVRAQAVTRFEQQAQRLHGLGEGAFHPARAVVQLGPVAVE
jgi:predicted secreted protein